MSRTYLPALLVLAVTVATAATKPIVRGTFDFDTTELVVTNGTTAVFTALENATTGYEWFLESALTNGCDLTLEHLAPREPRPGEQRLCGAPGSIRLTVTPQAVTNGTVVGELQYKRGWETGVKPVSRVAIVVR